MRVHTRSLLAGLLAAAAAQAAPPKAAPAPASVSPAAKAAAKAITADAIRAHVRFLASDLLEGRGPGTRGDELARLYLQTRMEGLGLKPGAPGGGWFQRVPLIGIKRVSNDPATFVGPGGTATGTLGENFVAVSGGQTETAALDGAEIVFVGYGIEAPEYRWDDFKDADLAGKVLLVMNNDPEGSKEEPNLFAGKTRLWYGRWDYKYLTAARKKAAGAIIIHTTPSAGYGWQVIQTGWMGERFELPDDGTPRLVSRMWAAEDLARKIASLGGQDLDALRAAAQKRDFRPVPLGVKVSISLRNALSKKESANVVGVLPGSDPKRSGEAVIYTAHHDHLGMKADAKPGEDAIYNGALDNASGSAGLAAIAAAFASLPKAPARSTYFAFVAAEEQGLLGSELLAKSPPVPAGRIAANVNVDGVGWYGRTRDLVYIGLGKSSLDADVKALAAMQGRRVDGDQFPDRGSFYRSDQFNFARQGVPAAYFHTGTDVVGKPKGFGRAEQERYEDKDYHQPSDEIRDSWDFAGAIEDMRLAFWLGVRLADAPAMPSWNRGDEFEAARKKAIAAVGTR